MLSGSPPLAIPPASPPSLKAVRDLLAAADVVLAIGTQFGPTDYDMYGGDGQFPKLEKLIRIDTDPLQLTRGARSDIAIAADADLALNALHVQMNGAGCAQDGGAARAKQARDAAFAEIGPDYREGSDLISKIAAAIPGVMMVGDSTQLVYAGNMYADVAGPPRNWFNSATGYGSLGYGAPAAVGGAKIGCPDRPPVLCITGGDGGFQFCLSELGTAMDENAPPVVFLVWNNSGYGEIEDYMVSNKIAPIGGVRPPSPPPDFQKLAESYGLASRQILDIADLPDAIATAVETKQPYLLEYVAER